MGKTQGRMLQEIDEQVVAAQGLYSWDLQGGIKARVSHHFTERETEA